VLERLREWARDKPSVRVVEGTWQARLPELGDFDRIFFDDFGAAGMSEAEMLRCCPDAEYCGEYQRAKTHFHAFINICLRWHMRPGALLSGYLVQPISLDRADASLTLERMPVRPAPSCHYFHDSVALVPCIEKIEAAGDTGGGKIEAAGGAGGGEIEAAGGTGGGKIKVAGGTDGGKIEAAESTGGGATAAASHWVGAAGADAPREHEKKRAKLSTSSADTGLLRDKGEH